jgi:endonuclease/exonuclease/phosphatase (EEP) superfamily protein YafD
MIDGKLSLVVGVYVTPGSTQTDIINFLEMNLWVYSSKAKVFNVVKQFGYYKIPIILAGDFNIDMKNKSFIAFMKDTFDMELNNDALEATTRNGSCIDGVFSRGFSALQTQNYISYFSHHRPLLSITDVNSKE